jgi:hypothetical protein
MQAVGDTPEEYARFLRRQYEMYGEIVRKAGIKVD